MRWFSSRQFPNSITITPVVLGQDKAGGRTKSWPASGAAAINCSFQPIPSRRQNYQGGTRAIVTAVAYFRQDPGTSVDDLVVWHAPNGDRKYSAAGPANPPCGSTALWSLELTEVR
jgi:hypothetical protein